MKRSYWLILIGLALLLASCESAPDGSTSTSGAAILVVEIVALPDGAHVTCVRSSATRANSMAISCDWEHRK